MGSIKQLFDDSVKYEESTLAHIIWHLLQEGKVKMEDEVSSLDFSQIDNDKLTNMIENNYLGFKQIKVFSLKESDKRFIFIFAKNQNEAVEHFKKTFKKAPINCHEYDMEMRMSSGNRFFSFRELTKEFQSFPVVAGQFVRPNQ